IHDEVAPNNTQKNNCHTCRDQRKHAPALDISILVISQTKGIRKNCPRNWLWFIDENYAQVKASLTQQHLKSVFLRYDTDGDGRLSNQELKDSFDSLGSRVPDWRAWRCHCYADLNGDGYIRRQSSMSLLNILSNTIICQEIDNYHLNN
ncbi:hypothetical protein CUMW_044810, partial [Citrus unshiu]